MEDVVRAAPATIGPAATIGWPAGMLATGIADATGAAGIAIAVMGIDANAAGAGSAAIGLGLADAMKRLPAGAEAEACGT
jgi:hypothetical protein